MIDDTRLALARLMHVDDHRRLAFTLNATDALNMAMRGTLDASVTPAGIDTPHVVTTVLEHNSISRPLMDLRDRGQITLTQVGCDDDGILRVEDIVAALQPETTLVAFLHVSNALGTIQPAAAIAGAVAERSDALVLLDASQSIGVLPVDVEALGADFIAFPGHKGLLGPTGTGALYVGPRVIADPGHVVDARIEPWRHGGTGGDSTFPVQPRELPHYLEGGTPNTVGLAGLRAGLEYVLGATVESIHAHEMELIARLLRGLEAIEGVRVIGPRDVDRRIGAVSMVFDGHDPADVGGILDTTFGIAVRPGLHCAPYAHEAMGTFPAGTLRTSVGPFTTDADIDALLDALRRCL